jgi:Protein of unknown function (DUF2950)
MLMLAFGNVTRLAAIGLLAIGLPVSGITPLAAAAATDAARAPAQETFASADDAVTALIKAVRDGDATAMRRILGPNSEKLVASGDPVADANARKRFLDAYDASHTLMPRGDTTQYLVVGTDAWSLPVPLIRTGEAWKFDAAAGAQEVIDRRIGRNELLTIQALLAAVEAEKDYFDRVKRGTGAGVYAQHFLSTDNNQDGLYWEVAPGDAPSPLGPLIDQAISEGYPDARSPSGKPIPYHGYFYHILKAQGPNAPGGAKDYSQNGQMTEGFAFVAWPATFESSGIMTFLVNQDGIVFQKKLGPATGKIAAGMSTFNPDLTWARVDIAD